MKTARLWIFLLLGIVLLSACGGSPVVAQVGNTPITAQDLDYHQAVLGLRAGAATSAHLALFQLIEQALMAEVGQTYGLHITAELLAEEAARVQAESRDPATLARIQAAFGEDAAAYQRLVIAPILVNQLLHAQFSLSHDIQAEPLARAQEALVAAQADSDGLESLAEIFGGEYRQLEIAAGQIQRDEPIEIGLPEYLAAYDVTLPDYDQELITQVVAHLAVGELHPQVVEDRNNFMVVRLLRDDGETAVIENLVIPKLAFDPWFQTHAQQISLQINDPDLQDALLAEVDTAYITDRLIVE